MQILTKQLSKKLDDFRTTLLLIRISILLITVSSSPTGENETLHTSKEQTGTTIFPISDHCNVDEGIVSIECRDIHSEDQLPSQSPYFYNITHAKFINCSLLFPSIQSLFPNVKSLGLVQNNNDAIGSLGASWDSVNYLNLSRSGLQLIDPGAWTDFLSSFPNIQELDLSFNSLSKISLNPKTFSSLKLVDISGNPLDCTSDLEWVQNGWVQLLNEDRTLCDLPPHQNKPKPIFKVRSLIKNVREECRVDCSCSVAYIWEQNHIIHSKTIVNCSGRGFTEFPDPALLPNPTDTLDLSNNQIESMWDFAKNEKWEQIGLVNLHLDNNRLQSIAILEGSDWFYNFHVFTARNNSISKVPVYVLENVFTQNKHILQVDLSLNPFACDCTTLSTLKIWLLKYTTNVKHIEEVRCSQTGEQIRYLKREEWCTIEGSDEENMVNILDLVSIFLALVIMGVVGKVYYDYWNFKHKGKLPSLISKM